MGARARANQAVQLMKSLVSYFTSHVFFLPWKLHLAIIIVLLFWRKDTTLAASWVGAMLSLRFIALYLWVCWAFVRASARWTWRAWLATYHFLFRFLPLSEAEIDLIQQHALLGRVVMIEGIICAGKSTIVSHLRQCPRIGVYDESVPPEVLARFNESGDGTEIQLVMGERRRAQASNSLMRVSRAPRSVGALHDRSLVGCRAFALWNFIAGSLSREALDAYLALAKRDVVEDFDVVERRATVLYIAVPVRMALKRLALRPGPDQGTSEKYMLGVSLMHAAVLASLLRPAALNKHQVVVRFYTSHVVERSCACQHLNCASATIVYAHEQFDGQLVLTDEERGRAQFVFSNLLQLETVAKCEYVERAWTAELEHNVKLAIQRRATET